jgi:hypothetical protein
MCTLDKNQIYKDNRENKIQYKLYNLRMVTLNVREVRKFGVNHNSEKTISNSIILNVEIIKNNHPQSLKSPGPKILKINMFEEYNSKFQKLGNCKIVQ